ncbi:unnamed protein product, partial [Ectocarpus sp. 12 AP-2014]
AGNGPAGVGASEAHCNWALAHAACRVCRVVGRTFQVAISYQTMQNQNRAGVDGGSGGSSTVLASPAATSSVGGERRGSGTSGPRPPSVNARHGFSEGLLALGGDGSQPVTPEVGTGSAFNLLGLPPSPAPRSGITRVPSAWGPTA